MLERAMIATITGASGTGKTSIAKALYERIPVARPLVSYTTREARDTDLPGDYAYLSLNEFTSMDSHGDFLWTAGIDNTRYGTTEDSLHHALTDAESIHVMVLVPERVPNVRAYAESIGKLNDVKSFLITTPTEDVLRARMKKRGETDEVIEKRIRESGTYEGKARSLGIPFVVIVDRDDLEEKIQAVLCELKV